MNYTPDTPKLVNGNTISGLPAGGPMMDLESLLQASLETSLNTNPNQFAVTGMTLAGLAQSYGAWLTQMVAVYPFMVTGPTVAQLMAKYFSPSGVLMQALSAIPADPTHTYNVGSIAQQLGKLPIGAGSGLITNLDFTGQPKFAAPVAVAPADPFDASANPTNPPEPGLWFIMPTMAMGPRWQQGKDTVNPTNNYLKITANGPVLREQADGSFKTV